MKSDIDNITPRGRSIPITIIDDTLELPCEGNGSVFNVLSNLRSDAKNLLRQEFSLAKAEIRETVSKVTKDSVQVGIGGGLALMAVICLLMGVSLLITFALEKAGLSHPLALFLGPLALGLLLAILGVVFLERGLKAFSSTSLSPEKTIKTIKEIKGGPIEISEKDREHNHNGKKRRTSNQIHSDVESTKQRMEEELAEIKARLSPAYFIERIKQNPVRSALITAGTGAIGYVLLKTTRHFTHKHA